MSLQFVRGLCPLAPGLCQRSLSSQELQNRGGIGFADCMPSPRLGRRPLRGSLPMQQRQGMTLVEILAVVVILGLLAVTLTVGITAKMSKAKQEICKTQIAQIIGQIQIYQMEKRNPPPGNAGLSAMSADPKASWYLEPAKLVDPWGAPYNYLVPGPDGQAFEVLSYGADGQPGGTGDAADISSARLGQ